MRDLTRLPKAHLHVHLESTIRWATLRDLGTEFPEPAAGLRIDGFRAFADLGALVRGCLRRPEDFTRVAREFCEDEAAQGTRYAEVTFTAASHADRLGGPPEMPLEAVLQGLAEGHAGYGIECRVLLDHSRRRSVDRAWRTLDLAKRYEVAGIGLAGDESYSLAPFAEVLDAARDAGIRLVHHAGETAGPESVREALDLGHADRLGHGIRVLDDPGLVAEVRDRAIPLEVCPSSNVALGLAGSFEEHPLPRMRDAGLVVTVNTDIPSVAGTSLTEEYARIRAAFGYDDEALAGLARATVDASFASEATRRGLHEGIDAWLRS